jgi:NAD(P)-dependent dehydrogenase (short-subunit alcohol dehydrogenase family)
VSRTGESAYSAAKAALSAYFESLATELWSSGVRFHLVYPALIELSGADGDDSLADTPNSGDLIPAPVLARAMLRQVERDELELFMPYSARDIVQARRRDLPASIEMMAAWYSRGAPTAANS